MKDDLSEKKTIVRNFLIRLDRDVAAIDDFFSPDCRAYLPGDPYETVNGWTKEGC
jgi:hypothetical protein